MVGVCEGGREDYSFWLTGFFSGPLESLVGRIVLSAISSKCMWPTRWTYVQLNEVVVDTLPGHVVQLLSTFE